MHDLHTHSFFSSVNNHTRTWRQNILFIYFFLKFMSECWGLNTIPFFHREILRSVFPWLVSVIPHTKQTPGSLPMASRDSQQPPQLTRWWLHPNSSDMMSSCWQDEVAPSDGKLTHDTTGTVLAWRCSLLVAASHKNYNSISAHLDAHAPNYPSPSDNKSLSRAEWHQGQKKIVARFCGVGGRVGRDWEGERKDLWG